MRDMTELEIINFSHNFLNLINEYRSENCKLRSEVKRLTALLYAETDTSEPLPLEAVRATDGPVWIVAKHGRNCWAIPKADGSGIVTGNGGLYRYSRYGDTWQAFIRRPPLTLEEQSGA